MKGTGTGMEIHSPSKDLTCSGCGKKFAKEFDFWRHWRVPIPCQIPNCPKTFRDDKLRAYINHHASEHSNEQNEFTQVHLQAYFRERGKDLRRSFVPNLCANKLGCSPESNVTRFGNRPSSATVSSTEPWNSFSSHSTVDADVYTSLPSQSAPETGIGSSPLTLATNGLLDSPDVFTSNPQPSQLGTSFDYGREKLQCLRPDGPGSYLKEQISVWKKALSTKRHHSEYLQRLLATNLVDEKSLEDKIRVAEEELDKILYARELDFQAPLGHQSVWDTFILDSALEGQNEI